MKTDRDITSSCNIVSETGCKPEIAGPTSEIIELKRIENISVLALRPGIQPREPSEAVGTAVGTVR